MELSNTKLLAHLGLGLLAIAAVAACPDEGANTVYYLKDCRYCDTKTSKGEGTCTYETTSSGYNIYCDCVTGKKDCKNNKNSSGYDDDKTVTINVYSGGNCAGDSNNRYCNPTGQPTSQTVVRTVKTDSGC